MAMINITDDNFASEVENYQGYVLIDFWAEWCGPCKRLGPTIEQIANELVGTVKVGKMNVDENPETPSKFGIKGIPTLILFQDGKQIASRVGEAPKLMLTEWIKSEIS